MSGKNLVCPADYTQKGNTCSKTTSNTVTCELIDSSSNANDRKHACYGDNGVIKPKPSTTTSNSTTSGSSKKPFNFRKQCSDVLKGRHLNLVQNIKELQGVEKRQFNKLQALQTSQVGPDDQKSIMDEINQLSELRENLFKELKLLLTQEQCSLSNDRYDLADQLSLLSLTEKELNNVKQSVAGLQQSRDNTLRMVEIANYETNRYSSHKDIFKMISFCALGVLASVYLVKMGWTNLGNAGIVLSITAAILLTCKKIYDNWSRNQINWNRYNWSFDKSTLDKGYDTVWSHDKKAFWKGVSQAESEAKSLENTSLDYWHKAKQSPNLVKQAMNKYI